MEFLSKLEETAESIEYRNRQDEFLLFGTYEDHGIRILKHIVFGSVRLSIQASSHYYCTPRKTFADLRKYKTMEFAVLKDTDMVQVNSVINNEKLITKLKQYSDGAVYAYVPVELIEELYKELQKYKTLKIS